MYLDLPGSRQLEQVQYSSIPRVLPLQHEQALRHNANEGLRFQLHDGTQPIR
jgi:hypothetical protein